MEVIHQGFDGLDVAFQGRIGSEFLETLEAAQARAKADMRPAYIRFGGVEMLVAETGGQGGYAFRADTGEDGAIWFFKRPKAGDAWGVRVSVKSLTLALYGLGAVRDGLYETLGALGIDIPIGGESIGRIDYCVDLLMPGFVLDPECFVMHSRSSRADHVAAADMQRHGTSGRVTSVTVGKMPGRQVIVYDKRQEVIQRNKPYWFEIWNARRKREGKPLLEPKGRESSQVWRVELRVAKAHLKKAWGAKSWASMHDHFGSLIQRCLEEVRYVTKGTDTNRARWPNHPLWDLLVNVTGQDLFEMTSDADPVTVRAVTRTAQAEMLASLLQGLSATYAVTVGLEPGDARYVPELVERVLRESIDADAERFSDKMKRAGKRYLFIGKSGHPT